MRDYFKEPKPPDKYDRAMNKLTRKLGQRLTNEEVNRAYKEMNDLRILQKQTITEETLRR